MAPETSIIIRSLNEARYIERLLQGIASQGYRDYEVLLVDSGSTDGTLEIAQRFIPSSQIHHIPSHEFTFGRSLNLGCRHAEGRYLVFVSAHAYPIDNSWLSNLVKPFDEALIGMVYGAQRATALNRLSEDRVLQRAFGQTSRILIDEPFGNNANSAVLRELWLKQQFDESLPGLEDLAWAKGIQKDGYRVYYAAKAGVYHVHEETLRQVYRRHYREAQAFGVIFPEDRYSKVDLLQRFVHAVASDFAYGWRQKKSFGKVAQIVPTRLAEFSARYRAQGTGMTLEMPAASEAAPPSWRPASPAQPRRVVIEAPGQHRIEDAEVPHPGPGEVVVQVAYVGVCATDVEVLNGSLEYYTTSYARYPIVPGHEYSGVVSEVGSNVEGVRPGDRVVGEVAIGCEQCEACAAGEYFRCAERQEVGVINRDGAYAHFLVMPAGYVHLLPREMSLRNAALVEPLAVCVKGARKLGLESGRRACVVGSGPLGNLCAQLIQARGLHVTAVDRDQPRRELLAKQGIDTLAELGDLDEYDYVVEASGNEQVIPHLIERSKRSAKLLLLGLPYTKPVQAAFSTVPGYDKTIYGSVAHQRRDWDEAIELLRSGKIRLDDHTTVVKPLEDYESAWSSAESAEHFKVLLEVGGDFDAPETGNASVPGDAT